jgi:hypothetical protein
MSHRGPKPDRMFELLRILRVHDVDFVLIGGLSVAFHGVRRGTDDIDIVPDPDAENLERLWSALQAIAAERRGLDEFRREEWPPFTLESLRAGGSWLLRSDLGWLDVLQDVKGVDDFALLNERAVEVTHPDIGLPIRIASRNDLIRMKRAAGRDLDLADIQALRMAEGLDE